MDRRKARTRRTVRTAFFAILERKRYAQITVQDILDEADIGRSTFYAHYQGKDDLLAQIVDEICAHAVSPAAPETLHDFTKRTDPASTVEHILRHIQEQKNGVRAIMTHGGSDALTRHLRDSLARQADESLPEHPNGAAGSVDRAFLVNHIAGSLVETITWWACEGFATDAKQIANNYTALIQPLFV